ncbi:MAG TPA: ATP-binding protein [Syntrophales bacterium]|nr:ATP-binding protein [Syntrophales bacterium]
MFALRQKLLLGFGGLFLVIALIGIQGITKVTDLGDAIDVILRENYRSVIACQAMKESLERMDSGAQFILLGKAKEGRDAIDKNEVEFEKALQVELNNITIPGEGERAARVQDLFSRYKVMIRGMEDENVPRESRNQMYFNDLLPLFRGIKDAADEILKMNQQNMYDANQLARGKAAKAREQMYILLLLGAGLAALYVLLIGRWILRPIKRLTQSVDEIKQGNLDLVVTSDSRDEIGHLSEAFNEMTASLRELRRSDEAKVVRSQYAAQQTFNNLPDAVAILDPEGRVEVATTTARDIFGLKSKVQIQELPFKWMTDYFTAALRGEETSKNEENISLVQHFIHAEEHYFRPAAAPIMNNRQEVTGVILILKDVTEQLEHDELKRGVISTVSHQLKTPLTSIRMALHLLLEEKVGALTPKQTELLIAAREDSDRLHRILENLLDISRIVSGKVAMEIHMAQPNQMVLEAVESFRAAARDHGVELVTNLPGDNADVWADTQQIGHVFANLLSNALRYTDCGGTVTVSATSEEEQVQFSVSDTGRGIPERYLPRIFDRFFRVPGQQTESGIGLGLAIVKEIVEAHGGSVSVESREKEGSVFRFTLPRADKIAKETIAHG